jgi:hypothetical protein
MPSWPAIAGQDIRGHLPWPWDQCVSSLLPGNKPSGQVLFGQLGFSNAECRLNDQ